MTDIRIVPAADFGGACLEALQEAGARSRSITVGLPTGSTPIALYAEMASVAAAGNLDISGWRPFAIDEYGGARLHPCSNRRFFERHWESISGAPEVEQFDPEAPDLEAEARRMREAIDAAGGLDIALLGIGLNGHVAFNEPGSAAGSTVRRVDLSEASRESARACWGDETPAWGLTLGLRELFSAETVIIMAHGAAKADIVARAIDGPETVHVPASLSRRSARAIWVLDEAAASRLKR
ncbi:MAG: 6-phosphogluconolactonase [Dehalococcoidia bacterium]